MVWERKREKKGGERGRGIEWSISLTSELSSTPFTTPPVDLILKINTCIIIHYNPSLLSGGFQGHPWSLSYIICINWLKLNSHVLHACTCNCLFFTLLSHSLPFYFSLKYFNIVQKNLHISYTSERMYPWLIIILKKKEKTEQEE